MFYSHQLLARKAALGQIWMAATMHAKMNRKKLDKLNIIKICEEILNPSVPMALRLSGILMGGVVIIYERKVKLLYDDVTRLMVELNEAWKVKAGAGSGSHSTDLPKRKAQAKYEAVTLPDNKEGDIPEIERFLNFPNTAITTTIGLQQQGAYICVCLDNVDETYITGNTGGDAFQDTHQADVDNITLWEPFTSHQADNNLHSRDERFEEDGEIHLNFTPAEQIATTLIPSPSHQNEQKGDPAEEIQDLHPENLVNQQPDDHKEANQNQPRNEQMRKRGRRPPAFIMDEEQIIIPGNVYQSWLLDASNIVSRRGKRRKNLMPKVKIANLMELPPSTLTDGILTRGTGEIQYAAPLLELWMRSIQLLPDLHHGTHYPPQPPQPSSSSPSNRVHHQGPEGYPFEDFLSGVGSPSLGVSIEKQRGTKHDNNESQFDILMNSLRTNLMNDNGRTAEAVFTPGNSAGAAVSQVRSFPGSASGHGSPSHASEVNSGRINKKRPYSWSRHSGSSLEPVDEEHPFHHSDPNFKLAKLSEDDTAAEHELLVETGPTQTQNPIIHPPIEKITDSIRMHLKTHFDTPGATQRESLNQLAFGMDRPRAAQLFYQTCVLATRGFVRVEQNASYGDILISRGAKM